MRRGRLAGKVALVTGAATGIEGRLMGIGGAAARLFAREGASVVVADRDERGGRTTANEDRGGGESGPAIFIPLDVTAEDQWERAIAETAATFGELNVLDPLRGNCRGRQGRRHDRARVGGDDGRPRKGRLPRNKARRTRNVRDWRGLDRHRLLYGRPRGRSPLAVPTRPPRAPQGAFPGSPRSSTRPTASA